MQRFNSLFCQVNLTLKDTSLTLLLIKPMTYMNLSGNAVAAWVHHFRELNITTDLLIILDDFMLPWKTIRLRPSGSHGGHNGLKHIIHKLGTSSFPRLKIGVGPLPSGVPPAQFVLSEFSQEEKRELPVIINYAGLCVISWTLLGVSKTASFFNGQVSDLTKVPPELKRTKWYDALKI